MSIIALLLSIIISIGSLAWGYADTGLNSLVRWIIAFGVLWLISHWQRWRWFPPFGLFLSILFAVVGLSLSFPIGWMFSGAIFALVAWDMSELRKRLRTMPLREDVRGVERRHVARISFLTLGGLLFASFLILWWRQWTYEWEMFLLGVIVLGALQIIAWFKK
ncbi:MAG: hypothetical protein HYZ21_09465 [Chloroflexi bacterium]|nr:hypothetical protein [Chloroflexota bacterium]